MKKLTQIALLLMCLFTSQHIQAQEPAFEQEDVFGQEDVFANVGWFKNRTTMKAYITEQQMGDVQSCNDPLGDERMLLVIPATDEIRLTLYLAVTDEYGNVEPDYDCPLCEAETGQALYFVADMPRIEMNAVLEAVDGFGRRAFWKPSLYNGRLLINDDFGCFLIEE